MKKPTKKTTRTRKPSTQADYVLPPGKALVMRTCNADMTSASEYANGFRWPMAGPVECKDWDPKPECGNGLHGLLWGEGDGTLLDFSKGARWLIVEIDASTAVDLKGKIKFPRGAVVFVGDRSSAPQWLRDHGGAGRSVVASTVSGGDDSTVSGGHGSTVSGGARSTVSGGDDSTVSGGDGSTVSGGYGSTVSGGARSTVSGGHGSTVSGGYGSTVKSGNVGIVVSRWYDGKRYRLTVGYVGEDGIKPNTFYRCDERGKLVEVAEEPTS